MEPFARSFASVLTFGVFVLIAAVAHAQTPTVITSLPYTISSPGSYVLNSNLNSSQTSGSLITVGASNVTIDFQDHYIAGPVGNTSQTAYGIYAYEQSNLTIKNGTVAYCSVGINIQGNASSLTNSVGHRVDNMRVTYCYSIGIYSYANPAIRITNCQVSLCGYNGATLAYGIQAGGAGAAIVGNVVSDVNAANGYGISAGAFSYVRQNEITSCNYGVFGGKYQDKLTGNVSVPYNGGTDAGGNN